MISRMKRCFHYLALVPITEYWSVLVTALIAPLITGVPWTRVAVVMEEEVVATTSGIGIEQACSDRCISASWDCTAYWEGIDLLQNDESFRREVSSPRPSTVADAAALSSVPECPIHLRQVALGAAFCAGGFCAGTSLSEAGPVSVGHSVPPMVLVSAEQEFRAAVESGTEGSGSAPAVGPGTSTARTWTRRKVRPSAPS